ncbi:MAG TPA: chromosomal replication initiator protein DnaA [Burkholderiales bacterium]|nr:chromosomal replication initiator protein DnaA [Burkholderiales bacterium]
MNDFWQFCLDHFQQQLPAQQFKTWITQLKFQSRGDQVVLEAPNRFVLQWIRDRFLLEIERLARERLGEKSSVTLKLAERDAPRSNTKPQPSAQPAPATKPNHREFSRLNPEYSFQTFVTGKANELARAAGLQVAERPGEAYNPLFIYGGSGLGKTHLIHAIGNLVHARSDQAKVLYISANQYISDMVRAYTHKSFDDFKRYYHSLDLLLIDDIYFFSGKSRTQEEFFYAFNALVESRKQIVITCDTHPREISGIEDRLVTRFGWGLTVAIEPPELEMRVAILLKKAEANDIALDQDAAFFIANHCHSHVRELEGAFNRVLAHSRFVGQTISTDLCREALKDLITIRGRQTSIENIQRTVADYYKIKVSEMYSKKRNRNVARPRQIAMALAKELTQLSLPDIGEAFGGRDHTTVLHACRTIASLKSTNHELTRDFDSLLRVLRS